MSQCAGQVACTVSRLQVLAAATLVLSCAAGFAATSVPALSRPPPKSIQALRRTEFDGKFVRERDLAGDASYSAYLISYRSAGLKIYAMVALPRSATPQRGFPVLIANHGFHPEPPKYGITSAGIDSRPGDYYRSVPRLFADQGFLVLMPDYRGHNISEGGSYARGLLASAYFTEDVSALVAVARHIAGADARNIFLWGHSMGGEVTLRAALTNPGVRAASLWSSVGGDIWDQAYYYSRYQNRELPDSSDVPKKEFVKLRADIAALTARFDWRSVEPLLHLDELKVPLIIQHSVGDVGANYYWSERLAKELSLRSKPYEFYSYVGDHHFFPEDVRVLAVKRDADFFRRHLQLDGRQ